MDDRVLGLLDTLRLPGRELIMTPFPADFLPPHRACTHGQHVDTNVLRVTVAAH